MLNAGVLTLREFVMNEPFPLATIQETVLEFLRGRDDAILFGAQAVNAYVGEPRMTQEIDVLSFRAADLAEEIRAFLSEKFHIAAHVREISEKGFRVYQVQKTGNRHLVDVRLIETAPQIEEFDGIKILSPAELIASKVISFQARRGRPKAGTDWRDLAMLLLKFPELKTETGAVAEILRKTDEKLLTAWNETVAQEIEPEDEDF